MTYPQTWIVVLRVVVGAWFLKAVWTKLVVEFLGGVVPYPAVSARFLGFHPKRVAEFAAGNPVGWYKDFLEDTVLPNSRTFASLQAYGEAALGHVRERWRSRRPTGASRTVRARRRCSTGCRSPRPRWRGRSSRREICPPA